MKEMIEPDRAHSGNFLCGVVEGFYGRPWTTKQRGKLFQRMNKMGMNTYIYAPKDDCKHRIYWRDLYSIEEAEHLTGMIEAATENDVLFVYALSPGLDMHYSNSKEVTYLKRKLEQVASFGCKAFALLFDDIEVDMCEADKQVFQSFAQAHVSVTNEVFQHLHQPSTFLFCPTEYCATRAVPNVSSSEYLNTIGSKLLPGVDIMWTGDKVITKVITMASIQEISKALQRPPVIWDNFHANDYDPARMFLGPYDGRSPELIPYLRGVLTNPNCEFEANFIPMHTLANWSKSNMEEVKKDAMLSSSPISSDIKLETGGDPSQPICHTYQPREALRAALKEWILKFSLDCDAPKKIAAAPPPEVIPVLTPITDLNTPIEDLNTPGVDPLPSPNIPLAIAASMGVANLNDMQMQGVNAGLNALESLMQPAIGPQVNSLVDPASDSDSESNSGGPLEPMDYATSPSSSPAVTSCIPNSAAELATNPSVDCCETDAEMVDEEPLTVDDLEMLVDFFYTPFEHGSKGVEMLCDFHWLASNCHVLGTAKNCEETPCDEIAEKVNEWRRNSAKFEDEVEAFERMVTHLCNAPNKALLFDLYPYIWDMKITLSLAVTYVKWLGLGHVPLISVQHMQGSHYTWANKAFRDVFFSGEHEPWVFRGGLQGEFKRLVPLEGVQDLTVPVVPAPPVTQACTVRPYNAATDNQAVYDVCRKTCDDGADGTEIFPFHKDLIADKLIGAFLEYSPEYCFVVEDCQGVCGYVLAALDGKRHLQRVDSTWFPTLKEKYQKPMKKMEEQTPAEEMITCLHNHKSFIPAESIISSHPSIVNVALLTDRVTEGSAKQALASAVAALKTNGSCGIYAEVPVGDANTVARYNKLGMLPCKDANPPEDQILVARAI